MSVEELAEDIARRGLLQSLSVRPVLGDAVGEPDMFRIWAGDQRFQTLSLLVKQKDHLHRAGRGLHDPWEEDSLAESMQRAVPRLDQSLAFVQLRGKRQSEEEIAAAFIFTPQVVRQRLEPASVAPALLDVYSEAGMPQEQLMDF